MIAVALSLSSCTSAKDLALEEAHQEAVGTIDVLVRRLTDDIEPDTPMKERIAMAEKYSGHSDSRGPVIISGKYSSKLPGFKIGRDASLSFSKIAINQAQHGDILTVVDATAQVCARITITAPGYASGTTAPCSLGPGHLEFPIVLPYNEPIEDLRSAAITEARGQALSNVISTFIRLRIVAVKPKGTQVVRFFEAGSAWGSNYVYEGPHVDFDLSFYGWGEARQQPYDGPQAKATVRMCVHIALNTDTYDATGTDTSCPPQNEQEATLFPLEDVTVKPCDCQKYITKQR